MSAEEPGADAIEDEDEEEDATETEEKDDKKKEGDAWGQWMRKGLMLQAEAESENGETSLVDEEEECNAACKVAKLKA